MTLLFHDSLFQNHDTGRHPERPERLEAIEGQLAKSGLVSMCLPGTYTPATEETILSLHHPQQLQRVKEASARGGSFLDADTVVSPGSFQVALAAVGACTSAVDQVLAGKANTALCLVRPPGHHATQVRSMGFCLFNNIALAAHHARVKHGLSRILIVDWDVHHGNGTQDIFYEDPEITYFSIHRHGHGFYPGTGAADETGTGIGLGHTFNMPVSLGTPRPEYHSRFLHALEKAADKIKPDLVLLSAGFDAHHQDPIGSLGLETEDFARMTRDVCEIARTHAHGRLVSCLEGGYHLQALAESVQAHLEELLHAEESLSKPAD
jgi:acetoin utilization deacetylase AcuC-like enzyme